MRRVALALVAIVLVAASSGPLTVPELLAAHRAGAPTAGLLRLVEEASVVAPPAPADLAALQAAGVADVVIQAVLARAPLATPTPEPRPDDPRLVDLVRLARAGLSDEILEAYLRRAEPTVRPTVDDLLYLQASGVSREVMAALLARPAGLAPAPLPPATAVPVVAPPAAVPTLVPPATAAPTAGSLPAPPGPSAPAAPPSPAAAPATLVRFEPLLRQLGTLGGNPIGTVTLGPEGVRWTARGKAGRTLTIAASELATIRLRCAAAGGEGSCFELRISTRGGEELALRDVNWETGGNAVIVALAHALRERFPAVPFTAEPSR